MKKFALLFVLLLAGCGKFFPDQTAQTLVSISVTPVNATIHPAVTQQFTATGTFSDGGHSDLTASVAWISSNTGIASVDAKGVATAGNTGTAVITATKDTVSGVAALTVAP
jgi:hypothetical protein